MKYRRRKINGDSGNAAGGQLLALSLFVMLLAFFIVLNAISNYEKSKVKPVLQSIETTFASRITEDENDKPSVTASAESSLSEGDVLDRLQSLFVAQIPSYSGKIDRNTGTMHVELSFDELEAEVMAIDRGDRNKVDEAEKASEKEIALEEAESKKLLKGFFLPALVALVKNDMAAKPYRMDILVNIDENPALLNNSAPQRMKELMTRIGQMAVKIEDIGLPERLMSIGVKSGKAGMVELFFRPHLPYNPLEESGG